jgi:hypothetical protein
MKYVFLVIGVFLLLASTAAAQWNPSNHSLQLTPPMPQLDGTAPPIFPANLLTADFEGASSAASPASAPVADLSLFPAMTSMAPSNAPAANSANLASPQFVQSVYQEFDWEIYAGYSFLRFFQVPGVEVNTSGLNFGVVYYIRNWVGAEGEFTGTFGSQYGDTAKFLLGMGGLRLRWSVPRGVELWAHGLVGGSHYLPQTANGTTGALAYELGGGVDINAGHHRWAYRIALDAVGTDYFSTYQFSPKASAGILFRF